ncbi:hypothetical protein ACKI16_29290 [Streptomyces scabiei]|uniref:hypothetical protein n=1 Tax=Streptomyces scabiei TaxID=1930 RepID=UPI0038F6F363
MIPDPTGIEALDHALFWGSAVSLVLAVGTGAWRIVRFLVRLGKRVEQYLTDWYGEPERPGVPARPGVLVRLQGVESDLTGINARLTRLEHEMQPNSGTSLRDAVDRLGEGLAALLPERAPQHGRPPAGDDAPDEGACDAERPHPLEPGGP